MRSYAPYCDVALRRRASIGRERDEKLASRNCVDGGGGRRDRRGLCRLVRLRRCRCEADADSNGRGGRRRRSLRRRCACEPSCSRCPRDDRRLSFLPRGNRSRVRRRTIGHSRATKSRRRTRRIRRRPEPTRQCDAGRDRGARFQNLDRRDGDIRRNRADGLGRAPQRPALVAGALAVSSDCGILLKGPKREKRRSARPASDERIFYCIRAHAFGKLRASASSTAILTATPISTCSRMSDCAPSAISVSISTPRFIGPGCMTSAPGFAQESFS